MTQPTKLKLVTYIRNRQTASLVEKAAGNRMEVLAATDVARAQAWIEELEDVAVVVAEHASDPSGGFSATSPAVTFLQRVQLIRPRAHRILICGSPDLVPIVGGLHSGAIETLLHCPITATQLQAALCIDGYTATIRPPDTTVTSNPIALPN